MTGMDVMEGLADTISFIQLLNLFNRFLILTGVTPVLAIVTLLALKCVSVYLQRTVKQKDREEAVFAARLHILHHTELQPNPQISAVVTSFSSAL